MASSHSIRRVLRHVLSLSLVPLVGACGSGDIEDNGGQPSEYKPSEHKPSEQKMDVIDTEGFEAVACDAQGGWALLSKLKMNAAADYLELRALAVDPEAQPQTLESLGDRCAKATDKAQCEAKVAAATSGQGFSLGECSYPLNCSAVILIVNNGDDVTVVDTPEGFLSRVLPVDAPGDALLSVSLSGLNVVCGDLQRGGIRESGGSFEVLSSSITSGCLPLERTLYRIRVDANGGLEYLQSQVIESLENACSGRRPAGLSPRRARGATRLGAYFAQMAHLEAASVHAFDALHDELALHGAPQALLDQARAARRDEVRHARVMRKVAEQHGGVVRAPHVERQPPRSLEAIAIDNAAEGCVRETFGALVGMWQARFARDLAVRRVMRRIARDETRHASLAWAIDAWIRPRLSPAEQRRMDEARQSALDDIAEEARRGYDRELVAGAGLPGSLSVQTLAQNFIQAVQGRGDGATA